MLSTYMSRGDKDHRCKLTPTEKNQYVYMHMCVECLCVCVRTCAESVWVGREGGYVYVEDVQV